MPLIITGVTGSADTYQLRLTAGDPIAIADVNGVVLDGDGDGQAGGDFVSTFVVAGIQPTLQSIQDLVFTPTCSVSGCHTGPTGPDLPEGQDLTSAEASFASIVGVPSVEDPSLFRVNPGDADASYLVRKIEGTAEFGERMPRGGPPLPDATIAAIRAWIDAGAPFESDSNDVTAPTVSLGALPNTVSGSVDVSASASDDVGVARVTFFLGETPLGTDTSAPYEIVWDTTTLANDTYTLIAEAADAAGNTTRSSADVEVFNESNAPAPTYTNDVQPIFFEKCNPCHTGDGFGGHNIGTHYDDAFLPASIFPECVDPGLLIGQCTIVLIQEGEMPFGEGCSGDPDQDAGDPNCLTQEEQDTIQAWIDAGMPE